jgi:CheY-like chemotaxis protein
MSSTMKEVEILLVEDNSTDAELAMRALKKNNFSNKLVWVKDGEEALDFIFGTGSYLNRPLSNGPRVIMLDLHLPKVDGLDVLRKVKSDPRTQTIPVVILTSSKEDRDVAESYRLGVNSYISKPVEFDEFIKVVAELGLYWLLMNRSPHAITT